MNEVSLLVIVHCSKSCKGYLKVIQRKSLFQIKQKMRGTAELLNSDSCLYLLMGTQSHQNEVEIFDENLAHISTWLYQTQIHLDEAERLPPTEREKVVKVRPEQSFHCLSYIV